VWLTAEAGRDPAPLLEKYFPGEGRCQAFLLSSDPNQYTLLDLVPHTLIHLRIGLNLLAAFQVLANSDDARSLQRILDLSGKPPPSIARE
jgi:hypothetical protein